MHDRFLALLTDVDSTALVYKTLIKIQHIFKKKKKKKTRPQNGKEKGKEREENVVGVKILKKK